ncbi:MAG: threonine--tRNA ligase, partial [Helicobacter sp.]|nr:threonine--tRNA ligase [Helicobacter sp.]
MVIGTKVNNTIYDLQTTQELGLEGEPIYFDNSQDSLAIVRHTCAHLMAEAIKSLYPEAQFFVGPVVEEGFYYDFRVKQKISEEDLERIESKMKEIANKGEQITKYHLPREEIIEKFKSDDLKQAVISRIPLGDGTLSVYSQGDFEDLCRGPHLPNLKLLKAFKLTKVAGAYLGGDEKAEMLTRIYGIAFADKESLHQYLRQLEEAKKRDHRKIGVEMELFTFDEEVGAGLPIWLPKGARLRRNLENLLT